MDQSSIDRIHLRGTIYITSYYESDCTKLMEEMNDTRVSAQLGNVKDGNYSIEDAMTFINKAIHTRHHGVQKYKAIRDESKLHDKSLIGSITIWPSDDEIDVRELIADINMIDRVSAEIGYWLDPSYRRQGLMTDAVKSLVGLGQSLGIQLYYAACNVGNIPSRKTLEKAGYIYDENVKIIDNGETEKSSSSTDKKPLWFFKLDLES